MHMHSALGWEPSSPTLHTRAYLQSGVSHWLILMQVRLKWGKSTLVSQKHVAEASLQLSEWPNASQHVQWTRRTHGMDQTYP